MAALSVRLQPHWPQLSAALRLSPRESQIVQGLLDSQSEDEVADTIGISSHTVHAHIERVYRKLRISSRAGLIIRIFEAYVNILEAELKHGEPQVDQSHS